MSDILLTRFAGARPTAGRIGTLRLVATLRIALRTYLTRQSLPDLTPRELADIGVSASAAVAEAVRLPWDTAPEPCRSARGMLSAVQRALERARTRRLIARLGATDLGGIGSVHPMHRQRRQNRFGGFDNGALRL